jgi:4-oxalocrotonate tautomerase
LVGIQFIPGEAFSLALPAGNAYKVSKQKGGITMPFIKVEAGKMSQETKEKLIRGLTKTASESLGIQEEAFTILIKENETDNWGVGGKVLTKVLEERAKKM